MTDGRLYQYLESHSWYSSHYLLHICTYYFLLVFSLPTRVISTLPRNNLPLDRPPPPLPILHCNCHHDGGIRRQNRSLELIFKGYHHRRQRLRLRLPHQGGGGAISLFFCGVLFGSVTYSPDPSGRRHKITSTFKVSLPICNF